MSADYSPVFALVLALVLIGAVYVCAGWDDRP